MIPGLSEFISVNADYMFENWCPSSQAANTVDSCNKDTGQRKTLQSWSRGVYFIVSGGGHISFWEPFYRYVVLQGHSLSFQV